MDRICGFCKKVCTHPKFLPCQHVFCKACLHFQIIKVPTNRQWEGFSCPCCQKYTKVLDPDLPLQQWTEQFPDHPALPRKSSEPILNTTSRTGGAETDRRKSTIEVGSVHNNDTLPGSVNKEALPTCSASPLLSTTSTTSTTSSVSSSTSSEHTCKSDLTEGISLQGNTPLKLLSLSESIEYEDEDVFPEDIQVSTTSVEDDVDRSSYSSDGTMCMMHPWKQVIILCKKCDAVACGLCLTESHPTCSSEYFTDVDGGSLLPDVTDLEEEVQHAQSNMESMSSGPSYLLDKQKVLSERIKQIAKKMIEDVRKQEYIIILTIQQLYQKEINRLRILTLPTTSLLTEANTTKKASEELSTHHFTDILQNSESLVTKQKDLIKRLSDLDFTCTPPEVDFIQGWEAIDIDLGDVIIDPGFYPKHDRPIATQHVEVNINSIDNIIQETDVVKGNEDIASPKTLVKHVAPPLPPRTYLEKVSEIPKLKTSNEIPPASPAAVPAPGIVAHSEASTHTVQRSIAKILMSKIFKPKLLSSKSEIETPKAEKSKRKFVVRKS